MSQKDGHGSCAPRSTWLGCTRGCMFHKAYLRTWRSACRWPFANAVQVVVEYEALQPWRLLVYCATPYTVPECRGAGHFSSFLQCSSLGGYTSADGWSCSLLQISARCWGCARRGLSRYRRHFIQSQTTIAASVDRADTMLRFCSCFHSLLKIEWWLRISGGYSMHARRPNSGRAAVQHRRVNLRE